MAWGLYFHKSYFVSDLILLANSIVPQTNFWKNDVLGEHFLKSFTLDKYLHKYLQISSNIFFLPHSMSETIQGMLSIISFNKHRISYSFKKVFLFVAVTLIFDIFFVYPTRPSNILSKVAKETVEAWQEQIICVFIV